MPEGNLLRMRRERTQSPLADQIVAGIADVSQFLEELVLRLGLLLPFRIGDGQSVGAVCKARIVARNARHENPWTHTTRPFCLIELVEALQPATATSASDASRRRMTVARDSDELLTAP